jgi:starch-binding outer membrane protein SusE/F
MKSIIKIFSIALLAISFTACKKDENKVFFEGGTAPVLSANKAVIPMTYLTRDNEAVVLNWTNPGYKFTTGVSSQDVAYLLEVDTTGANFTNPKRKQVSIAKDLSRSLTQAELNDYLLNQLELVVSIPHNIEMRIKATVANNPATALYSNVLKFTVTPYATPPKVDPPTTGKLFITGSATPASWQCGCGEAELLSQKFTQVTPTLYVLNSIALTGGGSYLLLPQYGSWSAKFGGTGGNNSNNVNGDDFKFNGSDLLAPAVSGNYKIEVDFQRGRFTVTKL